MNELDITGHCAIRRDQHTRRDWIDLSTCRLAFAQSQTRVAEQARRNPELERTNPVQRIARVRLVVLD